MTTGKPQQMAAASNPHDDLIAELSKLMAEDAQGSRAAPVAKPEPAADGPFTVRIPGAAAPAEPAPPQFDFGRPVEPVAVVPRQEPSVAAPPASDAEPAPFNFDFNFGLRQPEPAPQPVAAPEPVAAAEPEVVTQPVAAAPGEHDTIADLIAAELMGDITPRPVVAEPVPVFAAPEPEPEPVQAVVAEAEPVREAEPMPMPLPAAPKLASWTPAPVTASGPDQAAPARAVLRPVNLTPINKVEKPENDSFRIAPVFGLGSTPAASGVPVAAPEPVAFTPPPRAAHGYLSPAPEAPAPQAELDPIDEIESLIGRAVRVELENSRGERPQQAEPAAPPPVQPQERAAASPALRSLATPTLPPQSGPASGVDEAILAAAAATGAEIGWVQQPVEREPVAEPRQAKERAPRRHGLMRAFAGPLVAVVLLLVAGFGLYSVLGLGGPDGPAPVITADATPVKQVPETTTTSEPLPQSIVFNEMDGVVPGAEEQLVSRDQANVNEVTALPPTTTSVSEEGLANRKVRTVTVRPDGSIVSAGEDSTAGATILPVDRPNVPAVPGTETPSSSLLASANALQPAPTATPAATEPATATPVATAPAEPLVPGTEIAVVDANGAPVAGKTAPVPYVRPASVGDAPATGPTPVTAVVDAPQANLLPPPPAASQLGQTAAPLAAATQPIVEAATAPAAGATAPAYVQLSSQRTPEAAQQVANDMAARYGSILNGASIEINRVDLGARGIYYRVRVPANSQQSAAQLCSTVKSNGGDCIIM